MSPGILMGNIWIQTKKQPKWLKEKWFILTFRRECSFTFYGYPFWVCVLYVFSLCFVRRFASTSVHKYMKVDCKCDLYQRWHWNSLIVFLESYFCQIFQLKVEVFGLFLVLALLLRMKANKKNAFVICHGSNQSPILNA